MVSVNGKSGKMSTFMLFMDTCIITLCKAFQCSIRKTINLLLPNIHATLIEMQANC